MFFIHNTPPKIRLHQEKEGSTDVTWKFILSLVEELGEMARAYLAEHGRKPTNLKAQKDETYEQELDDILVAIFRFARVKNIDLHKLCIPCEKLKKENSNQKIKH